MNIDFFTQARQVQLPGSEAFHDPGLAGRKKPWISQIWMSFPWENLRKIWEKMGRSMKIIYKIR
jgi:hypothetical protein